MWLIRRSDVYWLQSDFSPGNRCSSYSLTPPTGLIYRRVAAPYRPSMLCHWLGPSRGAASDILFDTRPPPPSNCIRRQRCHCSFLNVDTASNAGRSRHCHVTDRPVTTVRSPARNPVARMQSGHRYTKTEGNRLNCELSLCNLWVRASIRRNYGPRNSGTYNTVVKSS